MNTTQVVQINCTCGTIHFIPYSSSNFDSHTWTNLSSTQTFNHGTSTSNSTVVRGPLFCTTCSTCRPRTMSPARIRRPIMAMSVPTVGRPWSRSPVYCPPAPPSTPFNHSQTNHSAGRNDNHDWSRVNGHANAYGSGYAHGYADANVFAGTPGYSPNGDAISNTNGYAYGSVSSNGFGNINVDIGHMSNYGDVNSHGVAGQYAPGNAVGHAVDSGEYANVSTAGQAMRQHAALSGVETDPADDNSESFALDSENMTVDERINSVDGQFPADANLADNGNNSMNMVDDAFTNIGMVDHATSTQHNTDNVRETYGGMVWDPAHTSEDAGEHIDIENYVDFNPVYAFNENNNYTYNHNNDAEIMNAAHTLVLSSRRMSSPTMIGSENTTVTDVQAANALVALSRGQLSAQARSDIEIIDAAGILVRMSRSTDDNFAVQDSNDVNGGMILDSIENDGNTTVDEDDPDECV